MVNAAEDAAYARKVRSGGIVMFDDVNWQSPRQRANFWHFCDTVAMLKHPASGRDICAVMRRR